MRANPTCLKLLLFEQTLSSKKVAYQRHHRLVCDFFCSIKSNVEKPVRRFNSALSFYSTAGVTNPFSSMEMW